MTTITLTQFHAVFVEALKVAFVFFLFAKWKTIKEIFCERDGGTMSSKRVIVIMGMATLCRLASFTTKADGKIDSNILISLTIIILTGSAIASFPQVMELFKNIKNMGGSLTKETTESKTETKKTVTATEATPEATTPS